MTRKTDLQFQGTAYRALKFALASAGIALFAGCQTTTGPSAAAMTSAPPPATGSAQPSAVQPANPVSTAPRISTRVSRTSFGRTVAQAVKADPDIAMATADILSASADLRSAERAFMPAFSIGADAQTQFSSNSSRNRSGISPYARVSQLIYDGGASKQQKAAALSGVTQAQDARLVAAASAALAAVEAYIDVLSAQERKLLQDRNLATHKSFLAQVEERRLVGVGSESDVLTLRSRTSNAQTRAIDAEAGVRQAAARFLEVYGTAPASMSPPPQAPELKVSSAAAVGQSPRMRTLNAEIEVAKARLAQAQAERIPRVLLGGTARPDNNGGAETVFDLSVEYSFDNRRDGDAAIARSKAELTSLLAQKLQLEREIKRSLDFLEVERNAGTKRLQAAANAVRDNRLNVAAARDEFSIGRRSLAEVLDAQRDFVDAQETVVSAKAENLLAGYQALALTGDIVDAFGITLPALEGVQ